MDPKRELLRHIVATIAYRGGKPLRGAPSSFAAFRPGEGSRTAAEILSHMGDLLDWALSMVKGAQAWQPAPPRAWDDDVARFFAALAALDAYLASDAPLGCPPDKLVQSALADTLTHIGQLAMMRRLAGSAVRGENYAVADIAAGRVGLDQAAARREFD
jgi:hypothetical protein